MARTFQTDGIVLRTRRFGEIHKGVDIITPGEGLVDATVFGAYKGTGKLGGSTELFSRGRFFFYRDPVKNRIKVQDVHLLSQFEELRGDLKLYYTACFWAELILGSHGAGGDTAPLYQLFLASLEVLQQCRGDQGLLRRVRILFAWHFLSLLGLRGPAGECSSCGRPGSSAEPLFIGHEDSSLRCESCALPGDYALPARTRRFLFLADRRKLSVMIGMDFGEKEERALLELVLMLLQKAVEHPLKSLELL